MAHKLLFSRKRGAISSVIGGVIIFGIVFTTVLAYFTFDMNARTSVNQAANQRSQLDLTSYKEAYSITGYPNASGFLFANITNVGPTTIKIVAIMVGWANSSTVLAKNNVTGVPFAINPGQFKLVNTTYFYKTGQVWIKAVSNLGSVRAGLYPSPNQQLNVIGTLFGSSPFGDLLLNFSSYTWYQLTSSGCTSSWCLQKVGQAFTIPTSAFNGGVAFSAQVTNVNPNKLNITLDQFTMLFQFWPGGSSLRSLGWFIVSTNGAAISPVFTPILLKFNQSVTLYFANGQCAGSTGGGPGGKCQPNSPFSPLNTNGAYTPNTGQLVTVFIFAHGWKSPQPGVIPGVLNTTNYGQNIPFVSTLYYP